MFSTLAPFQLACTIFKISQHAKAPGIFHIFPDECVVDEPGRNCLRIGLSTNDCRGEARSDLPIVFPGDDLEDVGAALTACTAAVPWTQNYLYKI